MNETTNQSVSSKQPAAHRTRRDEQREETRRRLYECSLEAFRRDGVRESRIEEIARQANVSRAAFYFHFPTKDDVLIELLLATQHEIAKEVEMMAADVPLFDVLMVTCRAFAAQWSQDPKLLPDIASVGLRQASVVLTERAPQPLRVVLARYFSAAAGRGELNQFLPPELLSDVFLVNALCGLLAWSANPSLDLEAVLSGVVELFLSGARAR